MMPNPFKKQWESLKRGRPGHRFRNRYETAKKTRKSTDTGFKLSRFLRICAALVMAAIGVVLVFIPGPAILFFLVAGGLLAAESLTIARLLDWTELLFRSGVRRLMRFWERLQLAGKIAMTGLATCGAGGCGYLVYRWMAE